jgi:hypothetical protein
MEACVTLTQALRLWERLKPIDITRVNKFYEDVPGSCCKASHEYYNSQKRQITFKPDHLVCEREKAWRRYVRLRDNNPDFPFSNQFAFGDFEQEH